MIAEVALGEAEKEFKEGAFAPFWDAVEKVVISLGNFDQAVKFVVENSQQHLECVESLDNDRPVFSVALDNLPDPRSTSQRLHSIVRRAQKDFQFATIYEQRKTNEILVAGFGDLANALTNMDDRISSSLNDLASTISLSLAEINETLESESEARRIHEEQELEILDSTRKRNS